jgi:hypothetical protein
VGAADVAVTGAFAACRSASSPSAVLAGRVAGCSCEKRPGVVDSGEHRHPAVQSADPQYLRHRWPRRNEAETVPAGLRSGDGPLSIRVRPSSLKRDRDRGTTSTGEKCLVNGHAK